MEKKRFGAWALTALALLVFGTNLPALAATEDRDDTTPPRLSLLEGEASYWRPGNDDWTAARLNTALAPGDALYAGQGRLEVQFGPRAFLRADAGTQLALDNQEPDYIVFKLTNGRATLDIRRLRPGETVEVDTPHVALTIEETGYYRIEVADNSTHVLTRRGGRARITTAAGAATEIGANQEVAVDADRGYKFTVYSARQIDDWDHWNYDRTDELLAAPSSQYVADSVYGAADLDRYGRWRTMPEYGRVWVPEVSPGWVPYSTGSWSYDPYYGWTWIDTAPWGWAPFHYGRWVYASSYWAWAPGPIVASPFYAPALVAFFGGSGFSVGIGIGVPAVSWVALGWGEPCLPWWGGYGFVGHPWWGGWGGPHMINHQVIQTTNINITNVNYFEHARDHRAIVTVPRESFGKRPVDRVRLGRVENEHLAPVADLLPPRPDNSARVPQRERHDPRNAVLTKPVVSAPSRALPDQVRGSRLSSTEQRGGRYTSPETAQPGAQDQSRGPRHPMDNTVRPGAQPSARSDDLSRARQQPAGAPPPLPDASRRVGQQPHTDGSPRGSAVQPRYEDQTRQGPVRNAPPPVPAERQLQHPRESTSERRVPPPHVDSGPRAAAQPPAPPTRLEPNPGAPRSFTNRDLEPPQPRGDVPARSMTRDAPAPAAPQVNAAPPPAPAPQAAPPPVRVAPAPAPRFEPPAMRAEPAPAPRVEPPRMEPRASFGHQPAPQRMERVAPAPIPNVAPSTGGGSSAGTAPSQGRGDRHPH